MKLSITQKNQIIKEAAQGISVAKLAKEFGVTPATIYGILNKAEREKDFQNETKIEIEREKILFPNAQSEADLWKTKFEVVSEDNQHLKIMYAEASLQLRKEGLHQ